MAVLAAALPLLGTYYLLHIASGAALFSGRDADHFRIYGTAAHALAWTLATACLVVWYAVLRRFRDCALSRSVLTSGAILTLVAACPGGCSYLLNASLRAFSAPVTTPDGTSWRATNYSFMQGKELGICRVLRDTAWATELERVAVAAYDYPQEFATLLVPGRLANAPNALLVAPDGLLVCSVHGECSLRDVYVAWDAAAQRAYAGHETYVLSPFLLFDDADTGDDDDLARLAATIAATSADPASWPAQDAEYRGSAPGIPCDAALRAALDHRNPWVHQAARRLILAGGVRRYPSATAALR